MHPFPFLLAGLGLVSASAFVLPGQQQPLDPDNNLSPAVLRTPSWSWEDCGLSTDPIQIKTIKVSPDPPEPGQNMTVTVRGTTREVIEEGAYADVTVKLGLIKILHKEFDICKEARHANASVQCPVKKGTHVVKHTVALPKEIPKAKFKVNIQGYSASYADMLCLKLEVDFRMNPFLRL